MRHLFATIAALAALAIFASLARAESSPTHHPAHGSIQKRRKAHHAHRRIHRLGAAPRVVLRPAPASAPATSDETPEVPLISADEEGPCANIEGEITDPTCLAWLGEQEQPYPEGTSNSCGSVEGDKTSEEACERWEKENP